MSRVAAWYAAEPPKSPAPHGASTASQVLRVDMEGRFMVGAPRRDGSFDHEEWYWWDNEGTEWRRQASLTDESEECIETYFREYTAGPYLPTRARRQP